MPVSAEPGDQAIACSLPPAQSATLLMISSIHEGDLASLQHGTLDPLEGFPRKTRRFGKLTFGHTESIRNLRDSDLPSPSYWTSSAVRSELEPSSLGHPVSLAIFTNTFLVHKMALCNGLQASVG